MNKRQEVWVVTLVTGSSLFCAALTAILWPDVRISWAYAPMGYGFGYFVGAATFILWRCKP